MYTQGYKAKQQPILMTYNIPNITQLDCKPRQEKKKTLPMPILNNTLKVTWKFYLTTQINKLKQILLNNSN